MKIALCSTDCCAGLAEPDMLLNKRSWSGVITLELVRFQSR
jgi:hypothetical protein